MLRRYFLLIAACAGLAACAETGPVNIAPDTTIYMTRHGDRAAENLSDLGRDRARALVAALEGAPIDAIYSPDIQRNLDTAAPLAEARGLPVETRAPQAPTARLARESAGRSVVWVGNKGNITTIWETLGLPGAPPLGYGDLAVIRTDAEGRVTIERRRYGP
ncbi:histidine phosphatase family protein [Salipiger mucosus]|uniref:Phosphoglycerate mutase family protein n=1 Tax=Salipiger mucosus DSM 16094 TaxID=1123237 RepID=S9RVM1_9RHOB|nr:histidine phosphatase family protein [Salipiger mucosus]EPX82045.1 hypothetical protein Salmuc_02411 [Salipiger mucosus DSM 16094]